MAKLLWGVLCLRIITDQETNNISYIDAVEAIRAPHFPFQLPVMTLGLLWRREEPNEELRIRFQPTLSGGGQSDLLELPNYIMDKDNLRTNIRFGGHEATQAGSMDLKVEQLVSGEWLEAYNLSIPITQIEPEVQQAAPTPAHRSQSQTARRRKR
jgi:hypothetical protein